MGTESLFNPIYRELSVNTTRHEDMPRFECGEVMKPVSMDITGGVRSGSGRKERKERKDRKKPKRPLLEPMRTHHIEPCVRIQAWAARPIADLGTYAYAYEASMRTHRSIPASINRGAFYHFKRAHFHI
ncbi:hypothetical protein PIB30_105259 [Stylosanthes scabra]|uniref:Uncharacterized protein n=1 Tax=Stylosanthes scabra TaxID=79078 RepID=A0ABU6VX11_9FABA|nr:hypothetical protein [Stylosanthes scabra]